MRDKMRLTMNAIAENEYFARVTVAAYAFGVAAGILLFFNPFVSAAKRKAPSPVEIEMEKYESDIRDTIVKIDNRLNKR